MESMFFPVRELSPILFGKRIFDGKEFHATETEDQGVNHREKRLVLKGYVRERENIAKF